MIKWAVQKNILILSLITWTFALSLPAAALEFTDIHGKTYEGEFLYEDDRFIYIETADGFLNIEKSNTGPAEDTDENATVPSSVKASSSSDGALGLATPLVATVGSGGISKQEFHWYLVRESRTLGQNLEALSPETKDRVLQKAIGDEILFQEALRLGLHRETTVRKNIIDSHKAYETIPQVTPALIPEDQLKAYYQKHPQKFMTKARHHLKAINLSALGTQAKKVLKQAQKAPESAAGWKDAGWQSEGDSLHLPLSKEEYQSIYAIKKGETLHLKDGMGTEHLFWLVDYEPAQKIPYEEATNKIRHEWLKEAQEKNTEALMNKVKSAPGGSSEDDKLFKEALKAGIHRKREHRELLINTLIQRKGGNRSALLTQLSSSHPVNPTHSE